MTTLSTFTNLIQTRHLFYVDYLKILISFLDSPLFPFFQPYLKRAADVILLNPKLDCSCPLLKIIQWFYFSFRIKEGSLFQKWSTSPCLVPWLFKGLTFFSFLNRGEIHINFIILKGATRCRLVHSYCSTTTTSFSF